MLGLHTPAVGPSSRPPRCPAPRKVIPAFRPVRALLKVPALAARFVVRSIIRLYYAPLRITGKENLPPGAVLLVANHQDSLLDPVLVGIATGRPVRFLAKATLFDLPAVGRVLRFFGMIPAKRPAAGPALDQRNEEMLNHAAAVLAGGESLGIFPEAHCLDFPRIEQMRTGAAEIALQAAAQLPEGQKLCIVPVGMNFEEKERFRSAVWVRIGTPLEVERPISSAEDEENPQAVRALTAQIGEHLQQVTIHLSDADLAPLLGNLEHLIPRPGLQSPGALARLQMRKRVADAMNYFYRTDRPRAEAAEEKIRGYTDALAAAGITPAAPIMRFRRLRLTLRLLRDALLHVLGAVPVLAGLLQHLIPYWITRGAARLCRRGPSTVALARLAIGVPVMILTYVSVWWLLRSHFLPWVAWTWTLLMPFCGILALRSMRKLRRAGRSLRAQAGLYFQSDRLAALRAQQEEIRQLVSGLGNEYAAVSPREVPLEKPWTWPRIRRHAARWVLALIVLSLLWTGYAHWKRSRADLIAGGGMELRRVPEETLRAMISADESALNGILETLPAVDEGGRMLAGEFSSGKRSWYAQADVDALHAQLRRYITMRNALLRIIWRYQKSEQIADRGLRARAFLCGCTAASALMSSSVEFSRAFRENRQAIAKLNEAEPALDIPAGTYDRVRRSLAASGNRRALTAALKRYAEEPLAEFGLIDSRPRWHAMIARVQPLLASEEMQFTADAMKQPFRDARDEGKAVIYDATTLVSTWMGDTKLREPGHALIAAGQLEEVRRKLQPGDILLERRNWFVSNAFLPGYWPHAALHIGTPQQIRELGLAEDPRVKAHWHRYERTDAAGHVCVVMESISEGVTFTSLEHSVGEADSVALLRPALTREQIREAIARAFSHAGKPYDFGFDFFSSDKLVCTELVFRAYDGALQLPLQNILGTTTLPAVEFVRKFSLERGRPGAQLQFICCLQGDADTGKAEFVSEDQFVRTLELPGNDLLME